MTRFLRATLVLAGLLWTTSCTDRGDTSDAPVAVGEGGLVIADPVGPRPTFHEFGDVMYGQRLRQVFRVRNEEGRALLVRDMLASCGCTQPQIRYVDAYGSLVEGSRERGQPVITLPAGVTADIVIEVDTTLVQTMNMDKLAQVRIRTDSDTNPYLTLEMHLVVVRAFRAVPPKLDLGQVPQSEGKSARSDITVDKKGNRSRIRAIDRVDGTFTAQMQETVINDETVWILTATAPPGLPIGPAFGTVHLSTTSPDGTEGAPFSVPILAQVTQEVVVHPPLIALGQVDPAQGARFEAEIVALVPGAPVKVISVRREGEGADALSVETKAVSPDEEGRAARHTLALVVPPGLAAGATVGNIVVMLDDETVKKLVVPFTVNVRP
jgi:hypothetical protein